MSTRERPTQRLACDRCHNQKLRCIRGSLPNGSCQRCLKANETCQSSPPLRLGRRANRPEVENGHEDDSAASSSQNGSTACTDGSEHQSEGDAPVNFAQLGFYGGDVVLQVQEDAHAFEWEMDQPTGEYDPLVFAAKNLVFPPILGSNQPQHESHTSSSNSNLELSDFTLDDYNTHFAQDWTYSPDSPIINVADASNIQGSFRKDLSGDTFLAKPSTGAGPPAQPSAPSDAQRQLTELLGDLYADSYHNPMAFTTVNTSNLNFHLMDVTVKAAHTLLNVINSLQGSVPPSCSFPDDIDAARGFVDAETGFLIAACYSRIFRNTNALAIGLHNAVSSNDISALRSMPSINIGSATPLYTTLPVIRLALWAQLLWQSVRELEKRLLTLSHSALLSPPMSELALRPLERSHMYGLVKAVDADVAQLEVNIDHLLQTTLHTLRHKSI